MTAPKAAPRSAPPWLFSLMLATGLGMLAIFWILASSALARREDARRHEGLRAELVRLDQAEATAYARNGRFASVLTPTEDGGGLDFTPASGLQLRFEFLSPESWRASVSDSSLSTAPGSCGIYRGPPEASPHRAVLRPGAVACW